MSTSDEAALPAANHHERIRQLAADQHGVVARRQLLRLGIGTHVIAYLVRMRRLRPLHRGVYSASAVGGRLQCEMAAVLAVGGGAVVSHRSAARLWDFMAAAQEQEAVVDVSIARSGRGPGSGVRLHRVIRLPPQERDRVDGVPVTSAARTLLDLAGCVTTRELERAFARAERAGRRDRATSLSSWNGTVVVRVPGIFGRSSGTRARRSRAPTLRRGSWTWSAPAGCRRRAPTLSSADMKWTSCGGQSDSLWRSTDSRFTAREIPSSETAVAMPCSPRPGCD